MLKVKFLALLTALSLFLPAFLFAEEITEEEIVPEDQKIYIDQEDERSFFQRGKLSNTAAFSVGYDNNAYLDSRRDGDAFTQTYYKANFTSPLTRDKKVSGILEYEFMGLVYSGATTLDLIKNGFHAAIENKISKAWEIKGGYRLNTYSYINSHTDNFYENAGYFRVRENLPFNMYHQLGYELSFRNFPERHTRVTADEESNKKRDDLRNIVDYEIGKYFPKDLVKFGYEYYNNNSNEHYINYYDYDSNKVSASLTHLFSDKVFGFASFARQHRKYRSRSITLDPTSKEHDTTYFLATALYYNLNRSLTFGLSYTYRQNVSNEPVENYSGSLLAVSTYYRF